MFPDSGASEIQALETVCGHAGFLLVPKAAGLRPLIFFLHEATGDANSFLDEARDFAAEGAICVCVQAPYVRPEWPRSERGLFSPEGEVRLWEACAAEWSAILTRLQSVLPVDAERIAAVGRNLGGGIGGFWVSGEERVRCLITAGSVPRLSRFWRVSSHPFAVSTREKVSKADLARFEWNTLSLDLIATLPRRRSTRLLLQFGTHDDWVPRSEAELVVAAAKPETVQWCDDGHDLNSSEARASRKQFLRERLNLPC